VSALPSDETLARAFHDLRTPVAMIAGYAELLAERGDPEFRQRAAAVLTEAVERLTGELERLEALLRPGR
jgi:signal transduction histidine kinase